MRFRFVHAADLHLDSPFRGIAADRRMHGILHDATFRAFRRIVDLCLSESAAFLLLAGDLFDARDRSVRARLALDAELVRLSAAGVQTFIVHGNHDPLSGQPQGAAARPGIHVFGAERGEVVVVRDGHELCAVQGISYPHERVEENLAQRFGRTRELFTVALLHANLGGSAAHANHAPCTVADLTGRGIDYWALGHVHTRAVHALQDGGLAVYPGNPQGRHVLEDGERTCALVDVEEGRARVSFVGVDDVRWHALRLDIEGVPSVEALFDVLEPQLQALSAHPGPRAHAVRVTLHGRGALHRELALRATVEQLEDQWREALWTRTPQVILESVQVQTRAQRDLAALAAEGGWVSTVLAEWEGLQHSPAELRGLWDDPDLVRLERALRAVGLRSTAEASDAILQDAALRVIDALVEDDA